MIMNGLQKIDLAKIRPHIFRNIEMVIISEVLFA